jgi:hypothetical protein
MLIEDCPSLDAAPVLRTGCSAGGSPHSSWARILGQGVSPCHRFLTPLHLLTTWTYTTSLQSRPAPVEPRRGSGASSHSQWRGFVSGEPHVGNISVLSHTGLRRQRSCLHGSILRAISRASRASNSSFCEASATGYQSGCLVAVGASLSSSQLLGSRLVWQTRLDLFLGPMCSVGVSQW